MKKMSFKSFMSYLGTLLVLIALTTSCKDDDNGDKGGSSTTTPVLDENFEMSVAQGDNIVTFTVSADYTPSDIWVTDTATQTTSTFVDGVCEVFIPIAGDYVYTCTATVGGIDYTSEPFTITIDETNTEFLTKGIWNSLTGGANGNRVWRLDLTEFVAKSIGDDGVETNVSTYGSEYFHCALDFYGDDEAGALGDNEDGTSNDWGPWGGTNIYGWGGTPEIGTISFDGLTGMVTLTLTDGVEADGYLNLTKDEDDAWEANPTERTGTFTNSFSMQYEDRPADFSSNINDNGTMRTLWEHMLLYQYSYLGSLSDEVGYVKFSDGLRFPMDKGRVGEGQFLEYDLKNVMIIHCSDTALVLRVKRTYEGFDDDGNRKENSCWLLYNYVNDGFTYTSESTSLYNTEVVDATVTTASISGDYKLAPLAGEWVNWSSKDIYNSYTAETMASTFASWGATNTDEKYAACQKSTISFDGTGNATINDVTYVDGAEVTTTYTTTYSVTNGYITFGETVTITGFTDMITLSGTNMYVITTPASGTEGSLWLGQNNGTKEESTAVQLIKQ